MTPNDPLQRFEGLRKPGRMAFETAAALNLKAQSNTR